MREIEAAKDETRAPALVALDAALQTQAPMVEKYVARLRRRRPAALPSEVEKRLAREFRTTTISGGFTVGAIAADPRVGKKLALTLSVTQKFLYLEAAVLYVLSRAEVHGIELEDVERRRGLMMAVLLGQAGSKQVEKVAERTGQHWARHLVSNVPQAKIKAMNDVLGRNFVTKYGTKEGIIVLGQLAPRGIGAAIGGTTNAITSHGVVKAADRTFGPAPATWSHQPPTLII